MNTFTFKAEKKEIQTIIDYFSEDCFVAPSNQYIDKTIEYNKVKIQIYKSGSVVITGKEASMYYDMFKPVNKVVLPQAGSDEVGTGDFFGPICVCATFIDEDIYNKISDLNLTDSKQLTDQYILKIGQRLMDNVPHSLLIVDNVKYNSVIKDNNMNMMKAKLHNQTYLNLMKKGYTLPKLTVVDDFCGKNKYYEYLNGVDKVFRGITFETKAESKYIAVACGSIISRYAFLKCMDQLSQKYSFNFPKGASNIVDEAAKDFVNKYGIEKLIEVAKLNFKTVNKI